MRLVTLRVQHDCPVARLSAEVPDADLRCWAAHRLEAIDVRPTAAWPRVAAAAQRLLQPVRSLPARDGGVLVWEPHVQEERSISRTLEAHGLLWLQPVLVRGGWEHYDAIAVAAGSGPEPERDAVRELARRWPTQVHRRRTIGADQMLAALFDSMGPVLDAPTDAQAEALVAARAAGYYRAPRGATTRTVAGAMGLSRSAFEERLRGAENKVLDAVAAALEHRRGNPNEP